VAPERAASRRSIAEQLIWTLDLFERLERRSRLPHEG
jgi:hypothetical protein